MVRPQSGSRLPHGSPMLNQLSHRCAPVPIQKAKMMRSVPLFQTPHCSLVRFHAYNTLFSCRNLGMGTSSCAARIGSFLSPYVIFLVSKRELAKWIGFSYKPWPYPVASVKLLAKWGIKSHYLAPIGTCASNPSIRHHVSISLCRRNSLHFASWNSL